MNYPYYHLSKKCGYAIRALFELASRGSSEPVTVRRLAKAQDIPIRFLEVILNELKQGGFVLSVRGKSGGYLLSRPASEIMIGQMIQFLEPAPEADKPSLTAPHAGEFVLDALLDNINQTVSALCDTTSLQDLVDQQNRNVFIANYVI